MDGIFRLLGGLGLFLLGMTLLTEGVKTYAGTQLKQALMRLTGTPLKALVSGAFITLLIQSSSATTVAVVGFVSAGVVSFSQAVGIVMGASLGTTATGWIVAGVGLKVSLGFYALPMVTAGAFARVLAGPRLAALGTAVAGFGLIFVGIDFLQQGMAGVGGRLAIAQLPEHGVLAHLVAAALGLLITIVVQSSSAAAAMALTALAAGTINFEQAASFVIGAAIGTTVTPHSGCAHPVQRKRWPVGAGGAAVAARLGSLCAASLRSATGASEPCLLSFDLYPAGHFGVHAHAAPLCGLVGTPDP